MEAERWLRKEPFDSNKVIALRFQSWHFWLPHIKEIKAKCIRVLNVTKYLAHSTLGCNRKVLLPLYHSLVRAILDSNSPIYELAPNHLSLLNPVQKAAICICTGTFPTSPALSLCVDSGYPSLQYRRPVLTANLLTSILQSFTP